MRHSSIVSALLLFASHLFAQDAAVRTADAPKARAPSDEAFGRVGGDNASGYQILHALDGWDAAEYADAMLISIRAKWYPRIQSLPQPVYGQRKAIIDVRVSGNGTIAHMARRASTGNKPQDNAA